MQKGSFIFYPSPPIKDGRFLPKGFRFFLQSWSFGHFLPRWPCRQENKLSDKRCQQNFKSLGFCHYLGGADKNGTSNIICLFTESSSTSPKKKHKHKHKKHKKKKDHGPEGYEEERKKEKSKDKSRSKEKDKDRDLNKDEGKAVTLKIKLRGETMSTTQ